MKNMKNMVEKVSAEEILERIHNIERMSTCMEDSYVLKRTTIRAMREYAQQESKITDEMIEQYYPCEVGQFIMMEKDMSYNDKIKANYYRRQGAKAMRDNLIK